MNKLFDYFDQFLTVIVRTPGFIRQVLVTLVTRSARFTIKEQVFFMKRLSMMLRSGMPLLTCLELLQTEAHTRVMQRFTKSLVYDVQAGVSLATALQKFESTLGQFCSNLVRVGEMSGTLPENLEYIGRERKKQAELRKQIIGALLYPAIIVVATLAITIFLILYIFPKIIPIFSSLAVTLPLSTRILMGITSWLGQYGWWVVVGLVLICISYPLLRQTAEFRRVTDSVGLSVPIVGTLIRNYTLAQMSRTLGLLLESDVRIVAALEITAASTGSVVYQAALRVAGDRIIMGQTLGQQLKYYPHLFPVLMVQMVEAGERTGNLGSSLTYLSDMYEGEIRDLTKNLTTIVEPVLMLLMGLCVGFVAISIITPIYGITQNLHP